MPAIYAGLGPSGWHVVMSGHEVSPPYDHIDALVLRGDGQRAAWVARTGGSDLVVMDGVVVTRTAPPGAIRADTLRFAATGDLPDGGPGLAYAERAPDGSEHVMIDGRAGPDCDEVGAIAFGPVVPGRAPRVGYPARHGRRWSIQVNGRDLPGGSWVSGPVFSPDGRRVAYLARRGARMVAVVDGRVYPFDLVMDGTLVFSHDSSTWALLVGDLAAERLFFAIGGERRVPLSVREVYSAAARASARGRATGEGDDLLRTWAQAEADRASRTRSHGRVPEDLLSTSRSR